jgi:hypothetical protein
MAEDDGDSASCCVGELRINSSMENPMARLPLMAAAALALVASTPLFGATTTPASAQEWSEDDDGIGAGGGDLRDFLMDALRARHDRRDLLLDLLRERRDRRGELLDLLRERRDWRDEIMDLIGDRGDLRGRLRARVAERFGEDGLRGRLRERIAERLGAGDEGNCYFLTRSLRDEDRSLLVIVRRRVCRD